MTKYVFYHLWFRAHENDTGPVAEIGETVAVGTPITERNPHRSVRARLRIRLF